MDWITNNAYRMICKQVWENEQNIFKHSYDFYRFTEFMSCEGYVRHPRKLTRHLLTTQGEEKTIAQIYGWNHDTLMETALDVDNKYSEFAWIELNIWCPSPKIMACEAGSGMLKCRPKTLDLIKRMSAAISKPFSIKTRAWLTADDRQEQFDFIIESAYHCHMITIHGRTYKQWHSWEVDRDFICKIKEELNKRNMGHIKIIWNWWLKSVDDWLQSLEIIDGIMFWQAAMCSPRPLTSYKPNIQELYDITLKHLHLNLANEHYFNSDSCFDYNYNTLIQPTEIQLNNIIQQFLIQNSEFRINKRFSLIEFRKHLFRYVSGLPWNAEFKRTAATITEYDSLISHIHNYFQPLLTWEYQ